MRFRTAPPGARTEPPPADDAAAWITGATPDGWFIEPPQVVIDRDEIIICARRAEPPPAAPAPWTPGPTPDGWFIEPPQVVIDRDEIIIWGRLAEPDLAADATDA